MMNSLRDFQHGRAVVLAVATLLVTAGTVLAAAGDPMEETMMADPGASAPEATGDFSAEVAAPVLETGLPLDGEKITYTIKKMVMKFGTATLTFHGETVTPETGEPAKLIVFRAEGVSFYDEERIFVDPQTYLPLRVERDVNIFGKKEKITEYYYQDEGYVRIVTNPGPGAKERTLKPGRRMENIYGFIYRFRQEGTFQVGSTIDVQLPISPMTLAVEKKETIDTGDGQFESFFLRSDDGKYRLWFSADDDKRPLRIDGAIGFGNMMMIMSEYQAPPDGLALSTEAVR